MSAMKNVPRIAFAVVSTAALLALTLFVGNLRSNMETNLRERGRSLSQFTFDRSNIASWREVEDGFSIKLNEHGKSDLLKVSTENTKAPVAMYVESQLVSSPVVFEPIKSGSVLLFVDSRMRETIRSLLPSDKEIR